MKKMMGYACVALLVLCGVASAQGVEIFSGQKVTEEFDEPTPALFRFEAQAGDLLTLALTPGKTAPFTLETTLVGPAGAVSLPAPVKNKLKAKKVPIPDNGTYFLLVGGRGLRAGATITLAMKLKAQKPVAQQLAVPGTLTFYVARGSELTITVKPAKGSGLKAKIDRFDGPARTRPLSKAQKATDTKLVKVPCELSGTHVLGIDGLDGTSGSALVTVKRKPLKPAMKKLSPSDLVETSVAKRFSEGEYFFTAEISGDEVSTAFAIERMTGAKVDLVPSQKFVGGPYANSASMDRVYPTGVWMITATMKDGSTVTTAHPVEGSFPGPVTVTNASSTRVDFIGGGGATAFFLVAADLVAEVDLATRAAPSSATGFDVPPGVVPEGWPVEFLVLAYNGAGKLTVGSQAIGTGESQWTGALSIGDLVSFGIDPLALRYQYFVVEGQLAGNWIRGDMARVAGASPYLFTVTNDGEMDSSFLGVIPGKFFGIGNEETLVAAVPARTTPYVTSEIQGLYNYLVLDTEGAEPESGYGTLRIGNGTWEIWQEKNAKGAGDGSGTWTYDTDGVVHAFEDKGGGPERIGNVMFLPGPNGGRLLVMDILDGGILLGVPQTSIKAGDLDGTYDLLASDQEDAVEVRFGGRFLHSPDEKIKLKFNSPWTGFTFGGDPDEPGLGMLSPDGIVVLGGTNEDEGPPVVKYGWMGVAIRR